LVVANAWCSVTGVISIRQLELAGLDGDAVMRRVRCGRLHRLHRGVYAVGHEGVTLAGRFMAAVLACGDGAALSPSPRRRTGASCTGKSAIPR